MNSVFLKNRFGYLAQFDDNSARSTAAVANRSNALLAALLLQDTQQGANNSSTAASKRMAHTHGTTKDVNLVGGEAQDFNVGQGDNAKGFVNLIEVNVGGLEAGAAQSNRNG